MIRHCQSWFLCETVQAIALAARSQIRPLEPNWQLSPICPQKSLGETPILSLNWSGSDRSEGRLPRALDLVPELYRGQQ
jgi:hypothetical protein